MIDLYYAPTPNGHKITLFLEEANLPYQLHRVNISKGEQFRPEFLAISPNNKNPRDCRLRSPRKVIRRLACLNPARSCSI